MAMRTPGVALQLSPGDTLLGRWTVAGQSRPLATGVLIAVREYHTRRAGRARVHWPSLAGRTVRRRLRAVADFLGRDPHEGWLPLLDAGEKPDGTLVHVMAEAPGGDLLHRGLPLPWRQGVEIVAVVGEALGDPDGAEAAAHTREVLP